MKAVREIALIALLYLAGTLAGKIIPFPAPLISMILLAILLFTGLLKEEFFSGGLSDLILKNLSFFFLPPGIRILGSLHVFEGVVIKLLLIMTISNILVMAVTSLVTQWVVKKTEGDEHDA